MLVPVRDHATGIQAQLEVQVGTGSLRVTPVTVTAVPQRAVASVVVCEAAVERSETLAGV